METSDKHSQEIQTWISLWQASVAQGIVERQEYNHSSVL